MPGWYKGYVFLLFADGWRQESLLDARVDVCLVNVLGKFNLEPIIDLTEDRYLKCLDKIVEPLSFTERFWVCFSFLGGGGERTWYV